MLRLTICSLKNRIAMNLLNLISITFMHHMFRQISKWLLNCPLPNARIAINTFSCKHDSLEGSCPLS